MIAEILLYLASVTPLMYWIAVICSASARIEKVIADLVAALEERGYGVHLIKDHPYDAAAKEGIKAKIREAACLMPIMTKEASALVFQAITYARDDARIIRVAEKGAIDDRRGLEVGRERIEFDLAGFPICIRDAIRMLGEGASGRMVGSALVPEEQGVPKAPSAPDPARGGSRNPTRTRPRPLIEEYIMRSDPPAAWFEGLGKYLLMTTADIAAGLRYGSSWLVDQQRIRVDGKIWWVTAVADEQTQSVLSWLVSKKAPPVSTVALLFQAAQHSSGTPLVIRCNLPLVHTRRFQDALSAKLGFWSEFPEFANAGTEIVWLEEFLEAVLKKSVMNSQKPGSCGPKLGVDYEIICHNFLQHPYAEWVPADLAGFEQQFSNIDEIYRYAILTKKSLFIHLDGMMGHLNIRKQIIDNEISISIKHGTDTALVSRIESILAEYKLRRNGRSWIADFSFRPERQMARESPYPYNLFEICNKCDKISYSTQEVLLTNGFRHNGATTQPSCKRCRSHRKTIVQFNLDSFAEELNPESFGVDRVGRKSGRLRRIRRNAVSQTRDIRTFMEAPNMRSKSSIHGRNSSLSDYGRQTGLMDRRFNDEPE